MNADEPACATNCATVNPPILEKGSYHGGEGHVKKRNSKGRKSRKNTPHSAPERRAKQKAGASTGPPHTPSTSDATEATRRDLEWLRNLPAGAFGSRQSAVDTFNVRPASTRKRNVLLAVPLSAEDDVVMRFLSTPKQTFILPGGWSLLPVRNDLLDRGERYVGLVMATRRIPFPERPSAELKLIAERMREMDPEFRLTQEVREQALNILRKKYATAIYAAGYTAAVCSTKSHTLYIPISEVPISLREGTGQLRGNVDVQELVIPLQEQVWKLIRYPHCRFCFSLLDPAKFKYCSLSCKTSFRNLCKNPKRRMGEPA